MPRVPCSGYKGRKAIAELMILNDELRELITARAPVRQLKEAAPRTHPLPARCRARGRENGESTLEESTVLRLSSDRILIALAPDSLASCGFRRPL